MTSFEPRAFVSGYVFGISFEREPPTGQIPYTAACYSYLVAYGAADATFVSPAATRLGTPNPA
jgi:hypothetical protein